MIITETHLFYFSPTHTSKQVGESIVRGMEVPDVLKTDLTLNSIENLLLPASALVVIVVPVYGGHVAPLAMDRLRGIRGTSTPAVLVVVYGNRAYEKALLELDEATSLAGFKVIAGATFIGEHSYSSTKYPIAVGRPDEDDIRFGIDFGKMIAEKVAKASALETLYPVNVGVIPKPRQPFFPLLRFLRKAIALRKSNVPLPRTPWVEDESACTHCGTCISHCPTGAIVKGDETHTSKELCIKCCACVKDCPLQVRIYDTPFAVLLSQCFTRRKEPMIIV